jgi:hypothetical protein
VFDPERMIEPISVRGLDSAAAAREGALELLRAFSASMPRIKSRFAFLAVRDVQDADHRDR